MKWKMITKRRVWGNEVSRFLSYRQHLSSATFHIYTHIQKWVSIRNNPDSNFCHTGNRAKFHISLINFFISVNLKNQKQWKIVPSYWNTSLSNLGALENIHDCALETCSFWLSSVSLHRTGNWCTCLAAGTQPNSGSWWTGPVRSNESSEITLNAWQGENQPRLLMRENQKPTSKQTKTIFEKIMHTLLLPATYPVS